MDKQRMVVVLIVQDFEKCDKRILMPRSILNDSIAEGGQKTPTIMQVREDQDRDSGSGNRLVKRIEVIHALEESYWACCWVS